MTPVQLTLYASALLFAIGLAVLLTRQNLIMMLIGLELMLNSANLNIIAFGKMHGNPSANMVALFIILIAVCEAAVGIAIVLRVYHFYKTSDPVEINELKERS